MIYKIDNKLYVKVSGQFVELELVYKNNDVSLKPTTNKIDNKPELKVEELNFMSIKPQLLKKHNEKNVFEQKDIEEDTIERQSFTYNKKSKYSK